MKIKKQIKQLLAELNQGVYEKEDVMALTLLTAIAGESIFLLGAPGVAKSLIARRLKFAFKDGTSFEYLMNRFSTPDEIFGPVSISKLKDEDKYERIIKNYLPSATVVFLDEVWKAGPSIQNSLLTVLNEKIYRNGDTEIKVPMKALVSASNELPMEGEGLEALWDRFLVRYLVNGIQSKKLFNDMITLTSANYEDNVSPGVKISDEQYRLISKGIDSILVSKDILNIIHIIRKHIESYNKTENEKKNGGSMIYISDRRWRKILRLMRTSAYLNEREDVDIMDCFLISHCIWHEPEQIKVVADIVKGIIQDYGYLINNDLIDTQEALGEFSEDVKKGCTFKKEIKYKEREVFYKAYYKIVDAEFNVSFNGIFDLITIVEFKKISKEPTLVNIHCDNGTSAKAEKPVKYQMSKGDEDNTIIYNGKKYKVKLTKKTRTDSFTKPPTREQLTEWTEKLKSFQNTTSDLKKEVNNHREKDLNSLKSNIFVSENFAQSVEVNWSKTLNEIEILEVELNRIKHYWENVKDETGLKFDEKED